MICPKCNYNETLVDVDIEIIICAKCGYTEPFIEVTYYKEMFTKEE